jgi:hypothetical protein
MCRFAAVSASERDPGVPAHPQERQAGVQVGRPSVHISQNSTMCGTNICSHTMQAPQAPRGPPWFHRQVAVARPPGRREPRLTRSRVGRGQSSRSSRRLTSASGLPSACDLMTVVVVRFLSVYFSFLLLSVPNLQPNHPSLSDLPPPLRLPLLPPTQPPTPIGSNANEGRSGSAAPGGLFSLWQAERRWTGNPPLRPHLRPGS